MKRTFTLVLFLLVIGNSLNSQVAKKAVLEIFTGSWNGWSPDANVYGDSVRLQHPNANVIAIHNSDSMSFSEALAVMNTYLPTIPTGMIDRVKFPAEADVLVSRNQWSKYVNTQQAELAAVKVSVEDVNWNPTSRIITARVEAFFDSSVSADLRFNLYVVEDSVSGSGYGFDQVNFLNNTSGHKYHQAGDPIIGFIHRNVARTMLGGPWGDAESIPDSNQVGNTYSKTYTYTLPTSYDENQIRLLGIVQEFDSSDANKRNILNSDMPKLISSAVGLNSDLGIRELKIFPNPAATTFFVCGELRTKSDVTAKLFNVNGKEFSDFLFKDQKVLNLQISTEGLCSGIYFLQLIHDRGSVTRIIVIR